MRVAVLLMCAVACCKAYGIYDRPERGSSDLLSKIEELLKADQIKRNTDLGSNDYKHSSHEDSTVDESFDGPNAIEPFNGEINAPVGESYGSHGYDSFMGPYVEDVLSYDIDRLYQFPGAKFIVEMIERNFISPGPFKLEMMHWMPAEGPVYMPWFLQSMQPQWMSAMTTFYGDWEGLPELFTRRMTEFVMNARMSCPSAFFDRFLGRWARSESQSLVSDEDNSVSRFFQDRLVTFFPTFDPVTQVKPMADEAARLVHSFLVDEMVQHIYGTGFKDVARFSHLLYWRMHGYFANLAYESYHSVKLADIVMPLWYEAGVRCENGTEVIRRHAKVVANFRRRFEHYTETYLVGTVEAFLARKAFELGVEFSDEIFPPSVVRECAGRIRTYMDELLDWHDEHLASLTAMPTIQSVYNYDDLFNFFREMQVHGEQGFVTKMFNMLHIPRPNGLTHLQIDQILEEKIVLDNHPFRFRSFPFGKITQFTL